MTMFCKRIAVIQKKAREQLEELQEAHRAESQRLLGPHLDVPGMPLGRARRRGQPSTAAAMNQMRPGGSEQLQRAR
ncbi:hypothetical protein ACWDKQ_19750 [Saccharopolyspora sp. NPDC000995]